MQTKTIITIIILSFIAAMLVWLIRKIYTLEKPAPGNCDYIKSRDPTLKWNSDCTSFQELLLDPSLSTPTEPFYLDKFTSSPSLGQPWGVNVWYKYKYVNGKTGGFSKSSPWTQYPIYAGSPNLPCENESCNITYSGKDSCKSNLAQLKIKNIAYPLGSDIMVNVHRYVTSLTNKDKPSDSIDGNLVGYVIQTGSGGIFIDTSKSPCDEINCSNVQGC